MPHLKNRLSEKLNIEKDALAKSQVAKKAIANVLLLEYHVLELANAKAVKIARLQNHKHNHQVLQIVSGVLPKLHLQWTYKWNPQHPNQLAINKT